LLAGELVRVETVAQLWEQHIITARQRLLQIAHDPELSADARQIVDRLVRAALHELSQYDPRRT
jgi:hypothetical protein